MTHYKWHIKPDVGEKKLWSGTAMLINIMEANKWERPVHCSFFVINDFDGLQNNMQINGLTNRILPFKVKGTKLEYDKDKFEALMYDPNNYKDYHDVKINNQPRASFTFGQLRRYLIFHYAVYLNQNGEKEKSKDALQKMNILMPVERLPSTLKFRWTSRRVFPFRF